MFIHGEKISMDRRIKTQNGWVSVIDIYTGTCFVTLVITAVYSGTKRNMNINDCHELLEHQSLATTSKTAKKNACVDNIHL